jgi:hypothetical protein
VLLDDIIRLTWLGAFMDSLRPDKSPLTDSMGANTTHLLLCVYVLMDHLILLTRLHTPLDGVPSSHQMIPTNSLPIPRHTPSVVQIEIGL